MKKLIIILLILFSITGCKLRRFHDVDTEKTPNGIDHIKVGNTSYIKIIPYEKEGEKYLIFFGVCPDGVSLSVVKRGETK